jgi:hypothetical protein
MSGVWHDCNNYIVRNGVFSRIVWGAANELCDVGNCMCVGGGGMGGGIYFDMLIVFLQI